MGFFLERTNEFKIVHDTLLFMDYKTCGLIQTKQKIGSDLAFTTILIDFFNKTILTDFVYVGWQFLTFRKELWVWFPEELSAFLLPEVNDPDSDVCTATFDVDILKHLYTK